MVLEPPLGMADEQRPRGRRAFRAERDRSAQPEKMSRLPHREPDGAGAERAPTDGDDAARTARRGADGLHLTIAEAGLPFRGEDFRHALAGPALHHGIDLVER